MFRKVTLALAAAIVLGLLIWPKTSWMARSRLVPHNPRTVDGAFGSSGDLWADYDTARDRLVLYPWADSKSFGSALDNYADHNPEDTDIAIGSLCAQIFVGPVIQGSKRNHLNENRWSAYTSRAIAIAVKNPKNPEAQAFQCWNLIGDRLAQQDKKAFKSQTSIKFGLEQSISAARSGELADPDNAFFPMTEARAQFALGNRNQALAAWNRASHTSRYDSYFAAITWHSARAMNLACNIPISLAAVASQEDSLLPWYSDNRHMARDATAAAIQLEKSGNATGGVALRHQTIEIGWLMLQSESTRMGKKFGIAIMNTGAARPAGLVVKPPAKATLRERTQNTNNVYDKYLAAHGFSAEISYVNRNLSAGQVLWDKLSADDEKKFDTQFRKYMWFPIYGVGSIALAQWLLLFAFLSVFLSASLRRDANSSVPNAAWTVAGLAGTCLFAIYPVWWTSAELDCTSQLIPMPTIGILAHVAFVSCILAVYASVLANAVKSGPNERSVTIFAANCVAVVTLITAVLWACMLIHLTGPFHTSGLV